MLTAAHSLKIHDTGYESPFPAMLFPKRKATHKPESPGVKVLSGYYCVTKWKKRLMEDEDLQNKELEKPGIVLVKCPCRA